VDSIFDRCFLQPKGDLGKKQGRVGEQLAPSSEHDPASIKRSGAVRLVQVITYKSALLGHRSIATTATYLARMEGEEDTGWEGVATALEVE